MGRDIQDTESRDAVGRAEDAGDRLLAGWVLNRGNDRIHAIVNGAYFQLPAADDVPGESCRNRAIEARCAESAVHAGAECLDAGHFREPADRGGATTVANVVAEVRCDREVE